MTNDGRTPASACGLVVGTVGGRGPGVGAKAAVVSNGKDFPDNGSGNNDCGNNDDNGDDYNQAINSTNTVGTIKLLPHRQQCCQGWGR
jgi:hypothetical protein